MAYFEGFPEISYDPTGDKNYKTIKDILIRANIKESIKGRHSLFEKYDVKEGETPELVAHRLYEDVSLHWVILMFNNIDNPYYEWPMSQRNFINYVKDKYANPDAIHHYEVAQSSGLTTTKIKVDSDAAGASSVSNYNYEADLNDARKQIKVLKREYIGQITSEFFAKLQE